MSGDQSRSCKEGESDWGGAGQQWALDTAFQRFGFELALLRAPLVRIQPIGGAWQLLYKAGPQELYQHREGRHAVHNLAVARRALDLGKGVEEAIQTRAAVQRGAQDWLRSRWNNDSLARLARLSADSSSAIRCSQIPERYHARRENVVSNPELDLTDSRFFSAVRY